jgi:hypothetical protein
MERNIFEMALRQKLRFASTRGELTTEQLWDLPLISNDSFNLDNVAKTVNNALKATSEDSFVATSTNPEKPVLELKLEIVKHVIGVRLQEVAEHQNAASKAAERRRLLEILSKKQDAELENLTPEEIEERLKALGN